MADIFDATPTVYEAFWFLHPDHRGGSTGLRLLDTFEGLARIRGAKRIWMIHLTNLNSRLARLYSRRGYSPAETYYYKNL